MNEQLITHKLLNFGKVVSTEALFPTLVQEAAPLIAHDPYAFTIACCLDRGTKAEIIWTIPYYIKNDLGHLDPQIIHSMSLDELAAMIERLPKKPRYIHDAPKTIHDLTSRIIEECAGDAANIWKGKRSMEVKRTLMSIHGVGPGIANMTILLIEKGFGVRFDDLDHTRMDIKPDVHTMRVLYRLGVSEAMEENAAIRVTRRLNPSFPGELDAPLWEIGRKYCFASKPDCSQCPLEKVCVKVIE